MYKLHLMPDGIREHPPEWHFEKMLDFARKKRAVGEPGSNITTLSYWTRERTPQERAWRIGCYASVYVLPTAQMYWSHCTVADALRFPWEQWLAKNWQGITTRQERRCVRSVGNMSACLRGVARWIEKEFPKIDYNADPKENYEKLWATVTQIPYFGRYISTRFMEGLRRHCNVPAVMPDMRNDSQGGGWSPKKAMVYLYPEHAMTLLDEDPRGNALADTLVEDIIKRFAAEGFEINYYQLAAILCDYRGAFEKRKEYPGWDVDVEITFYDKIAPYWGDEIYKEFFAARAELLRHEALGEDQGWHGVRVKLATTLRDFGYNWSDLEFDYSLTKNLANPVLR